MASTKTAPQPHGTSTKKTQQRCPFKHSPKADGNESVTLQSNAAAPVVSSRLTQMAERAENSRPGRRRPFSTWMKKLTHFKGGSSAVPVEPGQPTNAKQNNYQMKSSSKKQTVSKNNPYPESGPMNGSGGAAHSHRSFSTVPTGNSVSTSSLDRRQSFHSSLDGRPPPTIGNKSVAPTMMSTEQGAHSDAAPSHAPSSGQGTNATAGCGVSSGRGADSTFSSPAPSLRSLTTTLTTIQSAAPNSAPVSHNNHANNTNTIQFSHQFPASPATAIPAHLAPQGSGGHPSTYSTATANNLLTDNASILTLASSSKRRRRRSMDTDASVRALAPSSLFGGSRESLPLSVLSANIDASGGLTATGHQPRSNVGALNERASIYSATGVAPALPSERNSYYAGKQATTADGSSVKSGFLSHGRNDSISGSIGGIGASGSPLASPREVSGATAGKLSRRNSAWGEGGEGEKVEASDDDTETEKTSV
ncbi:hypothetical protein QTJ16_005723 [Diplocarpon rosae]|uniref:Uncharacterized protein n=1 Tax=Diplocarpon rosae TaxID=946125 RepID=A0AAD9WDW2_9HELO|nr:hypothetical protein QTJ16_005723 [Diplocarpon rosae]